ncbi:Pca regulon regulatory protein [compost metagenome]
MPGSRLPAYCTSLGRVMLAALPETQAIELLNSHPLQARTAHTLHTIDDVLTELALVRTQGYAAVDQEVEQGLRSVAVPVKNARGVVVAALNGIEIRRSAGEKRARRRGRSIEHGVGRLKRIHGFCHRNLPPLTSAGKPRASRSALLASREIEAGK